MSAFKPIYIVLLAVTLSWTASATEQDAMIYNPNDQAAQPEVSSKTTKPKSFGAKAVLLNQKLRSEKSKDKKETVKTPSSKVPTAAAPKEEAVDDGAAAVNADADADVYGDE